MNNKILIVDDSENDLFIFKDILTKENYDVFTTSDPLVGLHTFREREPFLVILDLCMPKMGGLEFLAELMPKADSLFSVLVITAHDDVNAIKNCYELGASAFLHKPLNQYELRGMVHNLYNLEQFKNKVFSNSHRLEKLVVEKTEELNQEITKQQNIQESLAQLLKAVETIRLGITITSLDGIIIYANQAEAKMHNLTTAEMIGADVGILAPNYLRRTRSIEEIRAQRGSVRESINKKVDGGIFPVQLVSDLVFNDNGEPSAIITVSEDITERKKAEENLKKAKEAAIHANLAKSSFLSKMSHEIRTPMNSIIGMLNLLRETKLSDEQQDCMDTLSMNSNHLLTIINDILDFSKIEAGKLTLENAPFSIYECLDGAVDIIEPALLEKKLELAYYIDNNVPAWLNGDITRLRQILINLLNNAVKFTATGHIQVLITATRQEENLYELLFRIADTGIGIDQKHLETLFDAFSQVNAAVNRKFGGTGLGLSISRNMVEQMSGRIWVESEIGQGSVFSFTILLNSLTVENSPAWCSSNQPTLAGKRILFISAENVHKKYLSLYLRRWRTSFNITEELADFDDSEAYDATILNLENQDYLNFFGDAQNIERLSIKPVIIISDRYFQQEMKKIVKYNRALYCQRPVKAAAFYQCLQNAFSEMPYREKTAQAAIFDKRFAGNTPLNILIVEDNLFNQKILVSYLKKLGYEPDVLDDGVNVLKQVKDKRYDLILMDINMPQVNGIEATRQIRENIQVAKQPFIVAVTANAIEGTREKLLGAGMDDYISKPISIEGLMNVLERIRTYIDDRHAQLETADADSNAETVPQIEYGILNGFYKQMGDDFNDIAQTYFNQFSVLIQDLKVAFKKKDAQRLAMSAHTLKSTNQTMGFLRLAKFCEKAEQDADNGRMSSFEKLLSEMENSFEIVKNTLKAEFLIKKP